MLFEFAPIIQSGIEAGVYEVVRDGAGKLIGLARNKETGQFVAHAIGVVNKFAGVSGVPTTSLFAPVQIAMGGLQMLQTHRGFQKTYKMIESLQHSVGILQATTSVIGCGVAVGVVLSAVNLYQVQKLKKEVELLHLHMHEGFIDIKEALKDQGKEIIQRIDQVAQDVKYQQHHLVLIQASGQFQEALRLIKTAQSINDSNIKNSTLSNAQLMLTNALSQYNNPLLLEETCAAGHLRRVECAWSIEQAIALTYQIQNESDAVSNCLAHLQNKIRKDCLTVIERCESEEELDFIFPEIACIRNNDLPILESWQNHVDWIKSLCPNEQKKLAKLELPSTANSEDNLQSDIVAESEELVSYNTLKQKAHYLSLRDQLLFMMNPNLRSNYESYIAQQATALGQKGLIPLNWQEIPDLTLANLYWYFKAKDKTKV